MFYSAILEVHTNEWIHKETQVHYVYMPHSAPKAMGQLRVSFHQTEIEVRRALHIPRAKRLCKVKHKEIDFSSYVKERLRVRNILCADAQLMSTS